jgi:DNA-binding CsgD family transcriptional regulator
VVRALVGAGPAVLVVEDLHALDPASLNLVGELAAAPDLPALLVVTSRAPAQAQAPELVSRTLARLAGAPEAVRQHLGPLPPAAVAEVLAHVYPTYGPLPAGLARAVWDRTGGNGYALTELLAAAAGYGGPEALLATQAPGPEPELTAREAEVLACLGDGMSNKQIARSLGISVRTVTVHVSNLLRKTGTASRTEAALWAVRRRTPDATTSLTP